MVAPKHNEKEVVVCYEIGNSKYILFDIHILTLYQWWIGSPISMLLINY